MAPISQNPILGFLTWSGPVPTGGSVYDDRLAAALRARGVDLRRHRVAGTWPAAAERHRGEVAETLASPYRWLMDGIVACAVPELVADARERGRPVSILLHSLLSTEGGLPPGERRRYRGLEAAALGAAHRVITTSHWAAADLRHRYGVASVVAVPGVDPAPAVPVTDATVTDVTLAASSLLSLGSLTPTKDQLTLVEALGRLADLPWSARLVGGDRVRPDYTETVRTALDRLRLRDRIVITGPLTGSALDAVWADTGLLVLTSRSETYGMVVAEALARGIPAIVTAGTGAEEALGEVDGERPGTSVPPGAPDALAAVLRSWFTDAALRRRWRDAADRRRARLPSWEACADAVLAAVLGNAH